MGIYFLLIIHCFCVILTRKRITWWNTGMSWDAHFFIFQWFIKSCSKSLRFFIKETGPSSDLWLSRRLFFHYFHSFPMTMGTQHRGITRQKIIIIAIFTWECAQFPSQEGQFFITWGTFIDVGIFLVYAPCHLDNGYWPIFSM